MELSEEHDILFLREMVASDIFMYKKGSVDRGKVWDDIVDRLNRNQNPKFVIKEKRGVRDRWSLLLNKFKKQMVDEELASGIAPDDISEKDSLIEELMEKEESSLSLSTKKTSDRATAEEMRKQAMERMGDTAKRRNDAKGDGNLKEIKKRRTGGEIVAYLKEKAKAEQAIRQEENEIKRKEQELAMKRQDSILEIMKKQADQAQESQQQMLQQQQMMNQALVSVMEKLISK